MEDITLAGNSAIIPRGKEDRIERENLMRQQTPGGEKRKQVSMGVAGGKTAGQIYTGEHRN